MVTRYQGSKEVDPPGERSSRSLFLKTIDIFEDASEPEDFDYRLGSVQNIFKSTVSRSSDKLQELARNIVNDKSSNLSFSTLKNRVLMEKSSEAIPVPKEVNLRVQRQGLGSKRARFSTNPDSNLEVVNTEAALDVNDPEQFFEAYEQHENVKKGIKKQKRGVLSDSILQNTFLTNQPHHKGNPDHDKRSAIKYLHRSDDSKTDKNAVSSQELMDSRISDHEFNSAEEEENETIPAAKVNVREQRPGLGRKRARFSIKPDSSQHVVNIEPTLDVKNLNDPEEFFKACERKENAKKEIQKQMGGVLSDSELQTMSVINRPRRPGLLDHNKRRSLYKHLYQSHDLETSSTVVPTQESTNSGIPNEEYHGSGRASYCSIASEEAQSPNKVNEILDQLLSYNGEELEGDRVIAVLRERLKIKPIELQKLNLPDFPDSPKIGLSPATSRKLQFSSITHMYPKDGPGSSISNIASPSTQKSPFASFPSLTRRISRSSPSSDPFSADDIDSEPITSRSFEQLNKEFTDAARKTITESPLPEVGKNTGIPRTSASILNESLDVGSSASHLPGPNDLDTNTDNEFARSSPSNDPVPADGIDSEPVTCRSFEQLNKEFADATQKAVTESHLPEVDKNTEIPGTSMSKLNESLDVGSSASHLLGPDDSDIITDNEFAKDKLVAQINEAAVINEIHEEDELHDSDVTAQPSLITKDVALNRDPEENIEVNEEQSNTSLDKKGKAKPPSRKAAKKRKTQRRQSLAVPGIGTTWDDGVRRSTRIRVRPLEHWKGERLLFGRIHNSLPTVIGLKYIPPGESSDNPVLQVKSYVGDEYKELVDVAALH